MDKSTSISGRAHQHLMAYSTTGLTLIFMQLLEPYCNLKMWEEEFSDDDSSPLSARGAMALKLSDPHSHFAVVSQACRPYGGQP